MRKVHSFNTGWLFAPAVLPFTEPDASFTPVTLPHANRTFQTRTILEDEYQFESTYRKRFTLPETLNGQRAFLDFEGAMLLSRVFLNDELVGQHAGGYTPFSVEITQQLQPGENTLHVLLDSRELATIPPNGYRLDFLSFGGIYRNVNLRLVSKNHITTVFARPVNVLTSPGLEVDLEFAGPLSTGTQVHAILSDQAGKQIAEATGTSSQLSFPAGLKVDLWSTTTPALYTLDVKLVHNNQTVDSVKTRVGFRSAEFNTDGSFYLNGKALKLFGLNRHQTYPYIGMAAPARLQRHDADILKNELGCNIVRTSHYPQSPAFLDRCDEIGLLVLEELPGWQFIGDLAWKDLLYAQLQEMIVRDRNHPSIILWGTRINESPDDEDLYRQTNALARKLDPTRQTGGIRNFIGSTLLEDVFTFNDFQPGLTEPKVTPHLITEFAGHMFPTKAWDNEDRLLEHALVHARKQDLQMGHPRVAGAIGWCAFDYNTHPEFGSGDRICHHGVADQFRQSKWAGHFYRSQKDPSDEVVLKAATYWTYGDRAGGGNNPLVIFSNCDELEVFIGGELLGKNKPDVEQFPHLAHAPFFVRWPLPYNPWGKPFGDLKIIGYLGGKAVATQEIAIDQKPHKLALYTSSPELNADGADMAWVVACVEDKFGNRLPYRMALVDLKLEGDGELIGQTPLMLVSGSSACFVRAGHTAGKLKITASTPGLESAGITISLER